MTTIIEALIIPFLSALGGGLAATLIALPKKHKENETMCNDRIGAIEEGVQSLARAEIQREYVRLKKQGFAQPYDKNNINYLYKAYKGLSGNSYITELYNQIMDLPLESEEK